MTDIQSVAARLQAKSKLAFVDTHFHIWDLSANYYPWLTDRIIENHVSGDYSAIRKNYTIQNYLADVGPLPVVKAIHIQANHDATDPVRETRWLQSVADDPNSRAFPHGIVASVTLQNKDAPRLLEAHGAFPNLRGIRQVLPEDALENVDFNAHLNLLQRNMLSFDLHVRHPEMERAARLASRHGNIQFVVTHAGYRMSEDLEYVEAWCRGMQMLAAQDNVAVKLSGFGFMDPSWTDAYVRRIVLETIDIFGADRCMFASDFPVDGLARNYEAYWLAYEQATANLSANERQQLFAGNAERIYRV